MAPRDREKGTEGTAPEAGAAGRKRDPRRLAAALRENLLKRKAQKRARKARDAETGG